MRKIFDIKISKRQRFTKQCDMRSICVSQDLESRASGWTPSITSHCHLDPFDRFIAKTLAGGFNIRGLFDKIILSSIVSTASLDLSQATSYAQESMSRGKGAQTASL
jgi:hypothetical protein